MVILLSDIFIVVTAESAKSPASIVASAILIDVTAESNIFAVVILLSDILTVVTALSARSPATIVASAIFIEVIAESAINPVKIPESEISTQSFVVSNLNSAERAISCGLPAIASSLPNNRTGATS